MFDALTIISEARNLGPYYAIFTYSTAALVFNSSLSCKSMTLIPHGSIHVLDIFSQYDLFLFRFLHGVCAEIRLIIEGVSI